MVVEPEGTSRSERTVAEPFRVRPFRPPSWLRGPHLQTLAGRLLRPVRSVDYERHRLRTPDGDFLDLNRASGASARRAGAPTRAPEGGRRPTVVVLHGLEGCSESGYVVETCGRLAERGVDALALNFRGRSGEPNRRRRFYHSGETGDLAFVLERLREEGADPLGAVGFSLGGNVLLKLLGERGSGARGLLDAAVAVSVPFDLAASATRMERGMGRLYTRFFLRSLRRSVRAKAERGHEYDLDRLGRVGTLREFDDAFTAPVHGFESAEEYYRRSSSAPYLASVRVPTLILQARDDPFLPPARLPEEAMEANPWVEPVLTDRGGHVGFVARVPPGDRLWAEAEAARWMERALARKGRERSRSPTGRTDSPDDPGSTDPRLELVNPKDGDVNE